MIARIAALGLAALCVPAMAPAASACSTAPDFAVLAPGKVAALKPDRAYLLLRVRRSGVGFLLPNFLRVPTPAEVAAFVAARQAAFDRAGRKGAIADFEYSDKTFNTLHGIRGKPVAEDQTERTYLIETRPADYVLAGVGLAHVMWTCFCQGTVRVAARPGVVTDLGTILTAPADKPSPEPELASVTNLGPVGRMDYLMMAGGVRPAASSRATPFLPVGTPVVAAEWRAQAPFVIRSALLSNWLAPVAAVLAYRRGEVVDVRSGELLPPR